MNNPNVTNVTPILASLPMNQVAALASISAASGTTFDEVLTVAVGYALGDARHVFGAEFSEEGREVSNPNVTNEDPAPPQVQCVKCGFFRNAKQNGNDFFFCSARGFNVHNEVVMVDRICDPFVEGGA